MIFAKHSNTEVDLVNDFRPGQDRNDFWGPSPDGLSTLFLISFGPFNVDSKMCIN
jgi:hypothetical protein